MHFRSDEILRIADDSSNDWMEVETRSGRKVRVVDHEHIKRSEVRIRTRTWLMTRFAPKVFGDRLQLDATAETREALAARSPEGGLADAKALIARAKQRVQEAYDNGEVTAAEFSEEDR
jgi:hypothetical protein